MLFIPVDPFILNEPRLWIVKCFIFRQDCSLPRASCCYASFLLSLFLRNSHFGSSWGAQLPSPTSHPHHPCLPSRLRTCRFCRICLDLVHELSAAFGAARSVCCVQGARLAEAWRNRQSRAGGLPCLEVDAICPWKVRHLPLLQVTNWWNGDSIWLTALNS